MPRPHPKPVGSVEVPTYKDVPPVLSVGAIGDYFGVSKQLANKWSKQARDFPGVFAELPAGNLYLTADVIAWGVAHERKRAGGPRETGDPRPPSVQKKATRRRAAA